jgi:hypothetical protein
MVRSLSVALDKLFYHKTNPKGANDQKYLKSSSNKNEFEVSFWVSLFTISLIEATTCITIQVKLTMEAKIKPVLTHIL